MEDYVVLGRIGEGAHGIVMKVERLDEVVNGFKRPSDATPGYRCRNRMRGTERFEGKLGLWRCTASKRE